MTAKRIILLLDGTWNDADVGPCDTNVVRLRDLIARTLGAGTLPGAAHSADATVAKPVCGYSSDGKENIVLYERGVGTNFSDRLEGGIFGDGLAENIRRAYKFLSYHYQPRDEIFVIGFSRGSYTARSLVGYIHATGLLRRDRCTPELERLAWDYYRIAPNDRSPGVWVELGRHTHDRDILRIECVAVFDTVGALGIPLTWFSLLNRDRFEFHNVELSSITNTNLHAIAIDERRKPFEASIWRKPKFRHFLTRTEQVWFSGAHADIGGSSIPEERRSEDHLHGLDDITLDWMIKRLSNLYPHFPIDREHQWKPVDKEWSKADQHEPRQGIYKIFKDAQRAIANLPIAGLTQDQQEVGRDRHADTIAEMVHISALERLGEPIRINGQQAVYAPANLISVLPVIAATYGAEQNPCGSDIRIVGWDGAEIDPQSSAAVGSAIVSDALDRLTPQGIAAERIAVSRSP